METSSRPTRDDFIAPATGTNRFNCPFCGAFAQQQWHRPFNKAVEIFDLPHCDNYAFSTCQSCDKTACWFSDRIVFPCDSLAPQVHSDCPNVVREIVEEARLVCFFSPKASAALLRLALQVFLEKSLGLSGKNINDEIAGLVKSQKISLRVQRAMDILRVVGNNAVHPGLIDLDDDPKIAQSLFGLLNIIIEETITRDKHINALYEGLPDSSKESIEKRDAKLPVRD